MDNINERFETIMKRNMPPTDKAEFLRLIEDGLKEGSKAYIVIVTEKEENIDMDFKEFNTTGFFDLENLHDVAARFVGVEYDFLDDEELDLDGQ